MTGDSLAKQFEQLEYHGSSDQQLLELKAKMAMIAGGKDAPKQLGDGGSAPANSVTPVEESKSS
jgi:hypothetical protein